MLVAEGGVASCRVRYLVRAAAKRTTVQQFAARCGLRLCVLLMTPWHGLSQSGADRPNRKLPRQVGRADGKEEFHNSKI